MAALLLGVLTIAVALGLVVDLIVSNVGAVSAPRRLYEANLLALVARVAVLFGLPHPQSVWRRWSGRSISPSGSAPSRWRARVRGNIGLVALYVAFMLLEQATFDRKIDALSPIRCRAASVRRLLGQIEQRIERYLWVKTIFSLATAVLSWCVLTAVGCQQAGFWALIIFMINYIPIVGSFFGVVFPALLVLVQFGTLGPFVVTVVGLSADPG